MDEQEYELKHWGILGMKWGVRNYQNEDGSLTPLGRIRYGVGPARGKTGNAMGVNDAGSLSDEELRRMTIRYQQQADYYNARNNYIYQEARFKENTDPKREKKPSKVGRFFSNVFGRPLENFMARNVEFGLGAIGYELLKTEHPEFAIQYLNGVTGISMKTQKDKEKEERREQLEKLELENKIREQERRKNNINRDELEDLLKELELQNRIRDEERKTNDPYYVSDRDRKYGTARSADSNSKYYDKRKAYEELMSKSIMDPSVSNEEIMEQINKWKYVYGKDMPIY